MSTGFTSSSLDSPFHHGEQRAQSLMGVREMIEPWARQVVRPYLPEPHRAFHSALPFLVAAARDAKGRPWATVLVGDDGFVTSPDPRRLNIAARPVSGDALAPALEVGSDLGLLGIELDTRRRNRVNGRVSKRTADGLEFEVHQSFGNCPQYIHGRSVRRVERSKVAANVRRVRSLSARMMERIRSADTFFIASGYDGRYPHAAHGMDASHRGGEPGFVRALNERHLVFPDYAGNNHFNTIGNLLVDPRAGLLFVDFERGSLLQLTGRARVDWDSEALSDYPGAQRLVLFDLDEAVELDSAIDLRWTSTAAHVRSLTLVDKVEESDDVASFYFVARDGGPLPPFVSGQHLPVSVRLPARDDVQHRTYSLSGDPARPGYRITVKRDAKGAVSRFMHDSLTPGDVLDAQPPSGTFVVEPGSRPVVLISAGVGITPMVSMLHSLVSAPDTREVWFLHGARDERHHPLREEVQALANDSSRVHLHERYSVPLGAAAPSGRIDASFILATLSTLEADFYLCGPVGFMADVSAALVDMGVASERIRTEAF